MNKSIKITLVLFHFIFLVGCADETESPETNPWTAIRAQFGSAIDPDNLDNYSNQGKPSYIIKDNTNGNVINNAQATLGRVLFYDKQLSIDNTVSCASCHKQTNAFSDLQQSSSGVAGGATGRHAMRLVNTRFAADRTFFWDERAATLELQTTQPIRDHAEMGFSGQNGRPSFTELISKLQNIPYYPELFTLAYGDATISEDRIQKSLAQFIRSIQSFDSKFDVGRSSVNADNQPFPNFTQQENQGKNLFLQPPQFNLNGERIGGGAGCAGCHNPPEFDIRADSRNNGVIGKINSTQVDLTNTRSPSLRDLTNSLGILNGPMMHDGSFTSLESVIEHYNAIPAQPENTNLDARLRPNGSFQKLQLTDTQKQSLVVFLKTLSGIAVYSDKKWSDPF
jgi:cytochrome c peroxidase